METTSYQVNKRRTKQEEKRKPNHLIEKTRMTTTHRDIEEAVQQLKERYTLIVTPMSAARSKKKKLNLAILLKRLE